MQSHANGDQLSALVAQFLASGGEIKTVAPQSVAPIKSKHHRFEPATPRHPYAMKVIAMHRAGAQPKDIRDELGMDHRTLVRILEGAGIDPLENSRGFRPTPDQLQQLRTLARDGVSQSEAARQLGIGRGKLREWAKRYHVKF